MESWVQSWRHRANAFCDFSGPPVESTAPATKNWCQDMRSAAPVTQNHLNKTEDLMLQNATRLRKSVPWPPNIADENVSCTVSTTRHASLQILFSCPTPAIIGNAAKPSRFAHFWQGAQSLAPATRKDIWTSKSGSSMRRLVDFDFEVCFAPQRRTLFRQLSFQKCSESVSFLTLLTSCFAPQRHVLFEHLNFPKWSEPVSFNTLDFEMCFAAQRSTLFRQLNSWKCSETVSF